MHLSARKQFTNIRILIIDLPNVLKASTFQVQSLASLDYLIPMPAIARVTIGACVNWIAAGSHVNRI